jgi:hypothetical protein
MEKFMDVNPDTPENIVTWLNDVTEAYSFPGEKAWKIQVNYNEDIGGGHLLKDVLTNVLASKIYSDLLCNTFIKDIDVSSDTKIEDPSPILEIWNLLYGNGFHDPNDQEIVYKIRNIENSQVVVSKDFFDIIVDEWVKTRIGESHKEIGEELGQKIIGVIFRYNES